MEREVSSEKADPSTEPRLKAALRPGYHSPQVEAAVRLNTNEAPEPPPPEFTAELAAVIGSLSFNRYPDRLATRLRAALAGHHGVDESQVFCANGSNEVIQSILFAYAGPERSCALFEPTYALHGHIARLTSTDVIEGTRGEDYLVADEEFDRILDKAGAIGRLEPGVVFLCSPNNPTGRREKEATIRRALDRSPGLVVVDEAYGPFAGHSEIRRVDDHPNLVVVRTFSKTWSLAGLRLGYAIASVEVVNALFEAALPYHLDVVKQEAGVLALRHTTEMEARLERLVAERNRVAGKLSALGLSSVPSDANFILFHVGERDAAVVWQRLLEDSVLVRDVSSWPSLAGFLRVTIGLPDENDAFLAALEAAIA